MSSFKTTTPSESRICSKSVISYPPDPPKVETVQNQFFHDHHSLPKWKLFKISPFKTTTPPHPTTAPSESRKCSKLVLSRPPHPLKIETVQNEFFQDYHTLWKKKLFKMSSFKTTTPSQSRNCSKRVLSRPPYPPKVESVQNQSFHD